MAFSLKGQFIYNLPSDWRDYLFSQKGLESFRFYPIVLALLFVILALMAICFFISKRNKKNRPLSNLLKLFGKIMLWESIVGSFIIFSRWQMLGFFAIRLFLLLWIVSIPISISIIVVLYLVKFRKKIEIAKEENNLLKYKP